MNPGLQGVYDLVQTQGLIFLFIGTIFFVIYVFVVKRWIMQGVIGLIIIAFAAFVISAPEVMVNVGAWLGGLLGIG